MDQLKEMIKKLEVLFNKGKLILLTYYSEFIEWIKQYINQAYNYLFAQSKKGTKALLTKTIGEEKTEKLKEKTILLKEKSEQLIEKTEPLQAKILEAKQKSSSLFEASIDRESPYYNLISKLWKYTLKLVIGVAIYFFLINTNFLWLTGDMPSVDDLQDPKLSQASELYTSDGVMFGKFFSENRTPVKDFKDLSPNLVNALIATEDSRFYKHTGVDLRALAGVFFGIVTGREERGGGSTITQQLAKNLFKTRAKESRGLLGYIPFLRKINYKIKEWVTAIKLERTYSKEEIITWYLNTVDFGSNAYGIRVASKTYFNTSPDSLSIQDAAVLVGIQKATTTYNPKLHYDKSLVRRNTVLSQMVKYSYLSQNNFDSLAKLPINLENFNVETPYTGTGNYFKNAVVNFIRSWAKEKGEEIDLYRDGFKIYTTIDSRLQSYAERAINEKMKTLQHQFEIHWGKNNPWTNVDGKEIPGFIDTVAKRTDHYKRLAKKFEGNKDSVNFYMNRPHRMKVFAWEKGEKIMNMSSMDSIRYYKKLLQAGMMTMDPFTGHIKAWVGGLDYDYFKYDHVKQGKRQPGSTFKPILYAAALDGTTLSPCDQIQDRPFSLNYRENKEDKVWEPRNADGQFSWNFYSLRKAMAKSVNSVAAALTLKIGELRTDEKSKRLSDDWTQQQYDMEQGAQMVVEYARKLGITSHMEAVPSIGLGSFDVSLYEMVAAYSTFLNNGMYTDPLLITRIEDRNGKILYEFSTKSRQAISREAAFLMIYMLRGGVEESGGTSKGLFNYDLFPNYKVQMAGKTGTTSNYSDAWYMGLTRDLVTGVWVGGDDRSIHFRGSAGEGSRMALPIFGRFMELVFKDKKLGYRPGPFPKASFTIQKPYDNCSSVDQGLSMEDDSLNAEDGSNADSLKALPTIPEISPDTTNPD
ncbi:MAG: transglycosylase domain-containing protein [Bacteroidota bacterium]